MTNRNEQHPADLAGAYALHALDADDTATFEAYLADSERARIEAVELGDTAVALGLAVAPVQPSAALKSNLMAMLSSTPQRAPLTGPADAPAPDAAPAGSAGGTAPGSTALSGEAPAGAARVVDLSTDRSTYSTTRSVPDDAGKPAADVRSARGHRSSATERAQVRWFKRPAQFMVAAAAAAALFVGGTLLGQALNDNQFETQQASSLARINAADDSQRAATTTADGQEATLVWSNQLGISAVLVDDLPALPGDQDYQVWYINGDGVASAGTFDSSGDGTAWRVLDGTMHAGDQVGVTVEPNGGSDQPTSDPIVAFQS
jgi:anti-sigma-K factor RskA